MSVGPGVWLNASAIESPRAPGNVVCASSGRVNSTGTGGLANVAVVWPTTAMLPNARTAGENRLTSGSTRTYRTAMRILLRVRLGRAGSVVLAGEPGTQALQC